MAHKLETTTTKQTKNNNKERKKDRLPKDVKEVKNKTKEIEIFFLKP